MIVVDSSPVVALIRCEPGTDGLADRLEGSAICAVNYSEIVAKMSDLAIAEDIWRPGLESLRLEVVPFERRRSELAGLLRPATQPFGLSFGDRACLSLALARNRPVLTTDRIWKKLDIGVDIELLR